MDPRQLEERIARAKEAARLASIAAAARPSPLPPRLPPPLAFAPPLTAHPLPPSAPPIIPEDVKQRIDHLVEFIRRNGPAFEETVRQRERENPSFAFLLSGAPFNDYFQWRMRQPSGPAAPPVPHGGPRPVMTPLTMPRGHAGHTPATGVSGATTASTEVDSMASLSVGAMANVCRLAKASGVPPYSPIPLEIVANVATLPPVEPGRLEIRLADFYRMPRSE